MEAIRLAEPTRNAYTIGESYIAAGTLRLLRGDWTEARSLLEHASVVLRSGNVVLPLPVALSGAAWALAELGESAEALDRARETEQLLLQHHAARGIVIMSGWAYWRLGSAYLGLGRLDDARRAGTHAVQSLPPRTGFVAHAQRLLGDVVTRPELFDAASGETHYREALTLAEACGMRPLIAHCHRGLGTLYQRVGAHAKAAEHLSSARHVPRDGHGLLVGRASSDAAITRDIAGLNPLARHAAG